jgi:hypothetical protein
VTAKAGSNGHALNVPGNDEAEAQLLRSIFAMPGHLDLPEVAAVQPSDFLDHQHSIIYRHIREAWAEGKSPEVISARLAAAGQWDDTMRRTLLALLKESATGNDTAYYADLVREEAERRSLWQLQHQIARQIDDKLPPADVRGFLSAYLDNGGRILAAKPHSLDSLKAMYAELRTPVVNGLLREAEIANLVSMSKVGKSWLAYSLGLSVQSGAFWLGKFPTRRGRVLLVDNELDVRTLAFRIPKVAEAMGIDDCGGLDVHSLRGQLCDIYQLGPFFRQFKPGDYSLVILDALYRLWPARMSENDNSAVTAVVNTIASYAERMGAAFAVVHHSSKGSQTSKSVVDVGSGAAALSRAVDAHIVLREHEQESAVVLEARTRSWEQPAPLCLRWEFPIWTLADDLSPNALKTPGKTTAKPDDFASKVYELLVRPMTKNSIKTALAVSGTKANEAIESLVEQGKIQPCEVITGGGKFPGFQRTSYSRSDRLDKVGFSDQSRGGVDRIPKGSPVRPTLPGTVGASPTREPVFDAWNEGSES